MNQKYDIQTLFWWPFPAVLDPTVRKESWVEMFLTQFQNLGAGPILTILWHFLPINFIVSISKDPNLFPSMTSDPLAPKWPI